MLYSLRISFSQWNVVHPENSINVGFQNYFDALADPIFHRAVVNTLVYLYEAAWVDGATTTQLFRYITLPLLRPTLVFLLVVLMIGGLNAYISFLLINRAGNLQNDAQVILTWMNKQTFDNFNFGQGAAI